MEGYGEWLQLSVFQCRLSRRRKVEMMAALGAVIREGEDHVLVVDIGLAEKVSPKIESLGKSFAAVKRKAVIV